MSTCNPIHFGSGVATVLDDHSLGLNALAPTRLSCRYKKLPLGSESFDFLAEQQGFGF